MDKLESRVKDLEDKWAKSKRINQQRKDKIEALERQVQVEKQAGKQAATPVWHIPRKEIKIHILRIRTFAPRPLRSSRGRRSNSWRRRWQTCRSRSRKPKNVRTFWVFLFKKGHLKVFLASGSDSKLSEIRDERDTLQRELTTLRKVISFSSSYL